MKALVFAGLETIELASVADPAILDPTDAIVQVEMAGICGSDLHPYHGREKGLDHGTVMGHELVGMVVDAGRDLRAVAKGDRVACPFTTSCGACAPCREGLTSRCVNGRLLGWVSNGVGLQGAQAEAVRVPMADTTLLPLPPEMDSGAGLLLGDVLSTGFHCAEMAGVRPGGIYAVIGCGPVGLSAVAASLHMGAEFPFAIDSIAERLAIATGLGGRALDHGNEDVAAIIRESTQGRGAEGVMELVGSPEAMRLALDLVRPGGTIASFGVHTAAFSFTHSEAYDRNLTYRTGRCPARSIMERILPLVASGSLRIPPLITHSGGLADGPRLYRLFDRKEDGCVKAVLRP